ncbi:hypothetical protein KLP40_16965 [Hymenobacter sp. NST-14]|uniref:XrtX-associated membrane protein n=1 Tax=Hymenobacter piscis TaxID=2839984 RepID=UPI001C013E07|nr:hypothetical protein [Hymenobacter piscis]MBT9394859.1 hypothetical protein [Hymenobacter piscis]
MNRLLRYATGAALIGVLFGLGLNAEPVFSVLTRLWQAVLPDRLLTLLHQGTSPELTRRSLPAMLTYGLLYCSLCLGLLKLLLGRGRHLALALGAYGMGFAGCALLIAVGKLGQQEWAYQLARRGIDGIVSPLPVVVLLPLLRWYQPPTRATMPSKALLPEQAASRN